MNFKPTKESENFDRKMKINRLEKKSSAGMKDYNTDKAKRKNSLMALNKEVKGSRSSKDIRKVAIDNLSKKKVAGGGPKFIGGKRPGAGSVVRDAKRIGNKAASFAGKIGSAVSSVGGKVGNAIKSAVHDDVFPTPQRAKYLKKVKDDKWKNSPTRKKLLELNAKRSW